MTPDPISSLFGFFLEEGLYIFAFFMLVVAIRAFMHLSLVTNPERYPGSLREYRKFIRVKRWGRRYLFNLRSLSQWLTNLIGDHYRFPKRVPCRQPFWVYLKQNNPWTAESYAFCLKLSVIYPVVSVTAAWVIGGDGRFGSQVIYDAQVEWGWRVVYGGAWLVVFSLMWFLVKLSGSKGFSAFIIAITVAAAFTFFLIIIGINTESAMVSFAGAIAVAAIFVEAFAGAVTSGFAVVAAAITAAEFSVSFVAAGGFSMVSTGAIIWLCDKAQQRSELFVFWLFFTVFLFSVGLALLQWVDHAIPTTLIMFLLLLPLANTLLDWLSLGATRHLLQRLQVDHGWWHAIWWAVIDLMLALMFLLLISVVLVSVISLANLFAINPVLDLQAVFDSLRDTSDHASDFWVYFLLLSTLIPTLVHFALVGGALTRAIPQQWRYKLVDGIVKHEHKTWYAYWYLVLTPAVGFVLAPALLLSLLWWIVPAHGGLIGGELLDLAESVAFWIDPTFGKRVM